MFYNLQQNTQKSFYEKKMREAFAMQKLLNFFSTKNVGIFEILTLEILTSH